MTKISKFLCIGSGGRKCACCFPSPGSTARKAEYRRAKRRSQREVSRFIMENTENIS